MKRFLIIQVHVKGGVPILVRSGEVVDAMDVPSAIETHWNVGTARDIKVDPKDVVTDELVSTYSPNDRTEIYVREFTEGMMGRRLGTCVFDWDRVADTQGTENGMYIDTFYDMYVMGDRPHDVECLGEAELSKMRIESMYDRTEDVLMVCVHFKRSDDDRAELPPMEEILV